MAQGMGTEIEGLVRRVSVLGLGTLGQRPEDLGFGCLVFGGQCIELHESEVQESVQAIMCVSGGVRCGRNLFFSPEAFQRDCPAPLSALYSPRAWQGALQSNSKDKHRNCRRQLSHSWDNHFDDFEL